MLKQELQWREPYVSYSINRKFSGVIPEGVYKGFVVNASSGMTLSVGPNLEDHPVSIAVFEDSGYSHTVSSSDTTTITLPAGTSGEVYLAIESEYIYGGGGSSSLVLLPSTERTSKQIIIAKLTIPSETTTITDAMIDNTFKTFGDWWKKTSSTSEKGIIEIATDTEVQTGTDQERAVTPSGLSARTATTTRSGLLRIGTPVEAVDFSSAVALTPSNIGNLTSTESRSGIAEIATLAEAQTGTDDYRIVTPLKLAGTSVPRTRTVSAGAGLSGGGDLAADKTISLGTPSTCGKKTTNSSTGQTHTHALTLADLVPSGAVMHFAMPSAPSGWLVANGATVSRITYADLFAAIGTTFGVGDGSTTFKLPDLRGEFIRGHDNGRGIDSGRAFGSAQSDSIEAHSHDIKAWRQEYADTTGGAYAAGSDSGGGGAQQADIVSKETGGDETRPRNIALLACIKY